MGVEVNTTEYGPLNWRSSTKTELSVKLPNSITSLKSSHFFKKDHKMFSRRLEKAYCCIPVRTGALVTAAIITLFSAVRVFAAFYKAKEWTLILGTDLTQFSRLEGLLEENWVENSIGKLSWTWFWSLDLLRGSIYPVWPGSSTLASLGLLPLSNLLELAPRSSTRDLTTLHYSLFWWESPLYLALWLWHQFGSTCWRLFKASGWTSRIWKPPTRRGKLATHPPTSLLHRLLKQSQKKLQLKKNQWRKCGRSYFLFPFKNSKNKTYQSLPIDGFQITSYIDTLPPPYRPRKKKILDILPILVKWNMIFCL